MAVNGLAAVGGGINLRPIRENGSAAFSGSGHRTRPQSGRTRNQSAIARRRLAFPAGWIILQRQHPEDFMKRHVRQAVVLVIVLAGCFPPAAQAQYLNRIGLTTLQAVTTNLNGAGVTVGQAEALAPDFEVNPSAVGEPTNLFTWIAGSSPYLLPPGQSGSFTNSLGVESGHADNVGNDFYGIPNGVATNVAHINNYDADTFYYHYIYYNNTITERIVNQSFTFETNDDSISQEYDNYAAAHNVLFVSGAGFNNYPVWSPATCYNGIGVGVYNNSGSPYGPTVDGRSKPDITASGIQDTTTSFSTPQVAGAAALLLQAGLRGDGGPATNAAVDIRTLKALLLNGAVKPADWSNTPSTPLHYRYGAGVLNVFNSYEQLAGGKNSYIVSSSVALGGAHPPTGAAGTIGGLSGWDFNTNTSSTSKDAVNHYYFNVTNSENNARFMATATLVWNRQNGQTAINNLALFLYNAANSNLVACSTSLVDNVQHIYMPQLPQGRYDLQVWKAGGGIVSKSETYALAWAFVAPTLGIAQSGANTALTWPLYPAGFMAETAANLNAPVWTTGGVPSPAITNGQNFVWLDATNAAQFFRLVQSP
jgi:hypothetical protein